MNLPGFTDELIEDMMFMYLDYYNYTLAMNETLRKAFVTGALGGVVDRFENAIKSDLDGQEIHPKLFYYSDHDDSMVMLTNALSYSMGTHYPPFASEILFYLVKEDSDGSYKVNATFNDDPILL